MQIAAEISYYPLTPAYEGPIVDFINRLNNHSEIVVETNSMSTQVKGPADILMKILSEEMQSSFASNEHSVFVCKFLKVGRSS